MSALGTSNKAAREASHAFKQKVADYLEVFGPATNKTICEAIGCQTIFLRSKLCAMTVEGMTHSELIPSGEKAPFVALYHFGPGESSNNREVTQRTVHKWKPQVIQHTELHNALFGL